MPHSHLTGGRPPNPPLLLLHEIGDLIRATGLSQSRLGQVLGVSTRAIRYWRDGTTAPPKMAVILMKIIAAQQGKRLAEAEAEREA